MKTLKTPGDYHPSSLINSSLKIISKLLANKLSKVIGFLVDSAQSVFLKGRCIIDNIATTEELIFNIHKLQNLRYIHFESQFC